MTEEQAQALMEALVNQRYYTIAIIVLALMGPVAAAIAWAYLSKRVQNLADKRDVEDLTTIVEDVKEGYARGLEEYREDLKRRAQASKVAELLAIAYDPTATASRFNQLAWEISLFLPTDLVCEITRCLAADKARKSPQEVLIAVRKHILKDENDKLIADNIVYRPIHSDLLLGQLSPEVRTTLGL